MKSAARSRSTRSRSPTTIPAARPASGSGMAVVSAVAAPRRRRSRTFAGPALGGADLERASAKRARDAGPAEVVAVWIVVRRRPDAARYGDHHPGLDRREARQCRGEPGAVRLRQAEGRHLAAVADRPDGLDGRLPRAAADREFGGRGRRRGQKDQPDRERQPADRRDRQPAGAAADAPATSRSSGRRPPGSRRAGRRRAAPTDGAASAATTDPRASQPLAGISEP